jgi:hypothetical protein
MECKTCQFFSPDKIQRKINHSKGWCRRYPPSISDRLAEKHIREGLTGLELAATVSLWPGVDDANGCGEHAQKKMMEV